MSKISKREIKYEGGMVLLCPLCEVTYALTILLIMFHFSVRDDLTFGTRVLFILSKIKKGRFLTIFLNLTKLVTNCYS